MAFGQVDPFFVLDRQLHIFQSDLVEVRNTVDEDHRILKDALGNHDPVCFCLVKALLNVLIILNPSVGHHWDSKVLFKFPYHLSVGLALEHFDLGLGPPMDGQ